MKCSFCDNYAIFSNGNFNLCETHRKFFDNKVCIVCGEKPTKKMVCQIAITPDEQEGFMSYKKIQDNYYYFCDKHALVLNTVKIKGA